ncbi:MAG: 50S ribosomal protein L11 [Candidatus Omnitrophica bacterium]|nr:50S ribosomal protein L11 [Candidatus Omnitrophota bacterium]
MAKKTKKIKAIIKLYCPAGQANPAPPVGPALGQHGLNIMEFCKTFNEKTKGKEGLVLPVVITAFEDRTFKFIIKSPAGSMLLKQAANIAKASGLAGREKGGAITKDEVREIAKTKLKDLNTTDLERAMKTIAGTARSMGIVIVETEQEKQEILAEVQERVIAEKPAAPVKAAATETKKEEPKA